MFQMENESNIFNENNEKYFIEISHWKCRLTAINEDLNEQFFQVLYPF